MIRFRAEFKDDEYRRATARFSDLTDKTKLGAGESIVKIIDDGIRKRVIPDETGWVDWYLDSMRWDQDEASHEWDLVVDDDIEKDDIPEGRSLIWIQGSWRILDDLSPWPMDRIPLLQGGVPGRGLVRPVSDYEYDFHKERMKKDYAQVKDWLKKQELSVTARELYFRQGFQVDVDFLVKRIEHGLGGFNRQPHFVFIRQQVQKIMGIKRRYK